MPLIDTGPHTCPYIRYNAPVNEATKKIRERFKVDEETGYPEHYNWRSMAKIGPRYRPEDIFKYIGHHEPERELSTWVAYVAFSFGGSAFGHMVVNAYFGRPPIAKCHWVLINTVTLSFLSIWGRARIQKRQGLKNKIYQDYMKKHPERFGEIYRPKLREVLFAYDPIR